MKRSVLILLVACSFIAASNPALALEWQRGDDTLTLRSGDIDLWTFNYGKGCKEPFFHPVSLPDGRVLTWDAPPDHVWHHALWFCWKYINGVNFWEPNRKTGKPDGETRWERDNITLPEQFHCTVSPEHAGRAWCLRFDRPTDGTYEDFYVDLRGIPPFLSTNAETLVHPVR